MNEKKVFEVLFGESDVKKLLKKISPTKKDDKEIRKLAKDVVKELKRKRTL